MASVQGQLAEIFSRRRPADDEQLPSGMQDPVTQSLWFCFGEVATSGPSAASACTIRCTGRPSTCFSYASRARNPGVNRPFGTGFAGGAQTVADPR
jgi:hypothetical protein